MRKLTDIVYGRRGGGWLANTPHRFAHRTHPANSPRTRSRGKIASICLSVPFDVSLHDAMRAMDPPRCCVFLASLLLRRTGGGAQREGGTASRVASRVDPTRPGMRRMLLQSTGVWVLGLSKFPHRNPD